MLQKIALFILALSITNEPFLVVQQAHSSNKIETSLGSIDVSPGLSIISNWTLNHYTSSLGDSAVPVMLSALHPAGPAVKVAFDSNEYLYLDAEEVGTEAPRSPTSWHYEDEKIRIDRALTSTSYEPYINVEFSVLFKAAPPRYAFISLVSTLGSEKENDVIDRALLYYTNHDIQRVLLQDGASLTSIPTTVDWIGATNRYFLLSVLPQGGDPHAVVQPTANKGGRISLVYSVIGNEIKIPFRIFFGAKELDTLRAVHPSLDHAVDFGWFTIIAYPLLAIMNAIEHLIGNYGAAIILLTLLLKVLTYPLTYKSMKSMREMAKLQPQLQKVREKYANDKEALNREMMILMKSHGYNPMSGCLPILIQMPVFFALYRVLYGAVELYQAPFMLWIKDLSASDPYYVTPVILTLTMFIQQKMTPMTATDPMQQKMMQFMPLIFGVFMLTLPSGLTVYMLTNALASIVQQVLLNKKLGAPQSVPAAVIKAR